MLANVWYLKRMKASGRTILVPTPLRPYRRITSVTKMIKKGLREERRKMRWRRDAMVRIIEEEFFRLLCYYAPGLPSPNITGSYIWRLRLQSHKDLLANLKNIKYSTYI